MIFYAIRRKSDGAFIPTVQMRNQTSLEPQKDKPPRLFTTSQGADQALKCWLKGVWSSEGDEDGRYPTEPKSPLSSRKASDMEVVPVSLRVFRG